MFENKQNDEAPLLAADNGQGAQLGINARASEPYWFHRPSMLFCAPCPVDRSGGGEQRSAVQCLGDTFWPDWSRGWRHPSTVNRLTRLAFVLAVILALVFRSWWPVAIAAGAALLTLLVAYGLQVQERRRLRERAAREATFVGVNRRFDSNAEPMDATLHAHDALSNSLYSDGRHSMASLPESELASPAASQFMTPAFPATAAVDSAVRSDASGAESQQCDWGTSSYVPNEFNRRHNPVVDRHSPTPPQHSIDALGCDTYPQCGPGGPRACASADAGDPRATIPNPSRHNSYDRVDARYERYEMKPQPVAAVDGKALLEAEQLQQQLQRQRPLQPECHNPALESVHRHPLASSSSLSRTPSPQAPASHSLNASAPATVFGVDPSGVVMPYQLPASYQRPQSANLTPETRLSASVPNAGANDESKSNETSIPFRGMSASDLPPQPRSQTEEMLHRMYQDVDMYAWDETVAKRAPRWQQNPSDPRTRRKMEQDAIELQSWRGMRWDQSA